MFYLPHYIWQGWEGRRLAGLVGDLHLHSKFFIDAEPDQCNIFEEIIDISW
jgi:hypothetical protein